VNADSLFAWDANRTVNRNSELCYDGSKSDPSTWMQSSQLDFAAWD
jgi:hypothetical protein